MKLSHIAQRTFGLLSVAALLGVAQAQVLTTEQVMDISMQASVASIEPSDLINWKVGDTANYDLSLGFLGKGTMVKTVSKEEGAALWIVNDASIVGQKEKIEILINKADGKILKMLRNGQEQQIPDGKIEIISQDYTEVTVPAGTFKCLHIVAKSKDSPKIEVWANPREIVMEGSAKQIAATSMGIDIDMQLTSQKRGN